MFISSKIWISLFNWRLVVEIKSSNSCFLLSDCIWSLSNLSISIINLWRVAEESFDSFFNSGNDSWKFNSSVFLLLTLRTIFWCSTFKEWSFSSFSLHSSSIVLYFFARSRISVSRIFCDKFLYLLASLDCLLRDLTWDANSFNISSSLSIFVSADLILNSASCLLTWRPEIPAASSRILLLSFGFWSINSWIWPCLTKDGDLAPVEASAKSICMSLALVSLPFNL